MEALFLDELVGMGLQDFVDMQPQCAYYGYVWDNKNWNLLMIVTIGTGFRVIAFVALYTLNQDKMK